MSKSHQPARIRQPLSEGGFSLVEVLLAITILSVGMMGTAVLTVGVVKANIVSKEVTVATTLAQDKMEEVRDAGYANLPSADSTVTENYGSIVTSFGGTSVDYAKFRRVTRTEVNAPAVGMKRVTVSVSRLAGQNPVVFKTILSR